MLYKQKINNHRIQLSSYICTQLFDIFSVLGSIYVFLVNFDNNYIVCTYITHKLWIILSLMSFKSTVKLSMAHEPSLADKLLNHNFNANNLLLVRSKNIYAQSDITVLSKVDSTSKRLPWKPVSRTRTKLKARWFRDFHSVTH